MNKQPKVLIIIPTWNRKNELERCLKSIQKINYDNKEIIIIDNGSSDGTIEMLSNLLLDTKVICNKNNLGASFAKNQGAIASSGDFLWFLDTDTEILNVECLNKMIDILNSFPNVAMVGGEIVEERGEKRYKVSKFSRFGMGTVELRNEDEYKLIECNFVTTANCLIRRDVFFEVGGFNPEYFYGQEDTDLSRKVIDKGYKAIVDHGTAVLHLLSIKQRYSHFFQQEKNRIRRYFLDENILLFPLVPFLDIFFLARAFPYFYNQTKKRNINESALLKKAFFQENKKKLHKKNNLIKLGLLFFLALIYGYLYNFILLPRILYVRFKYRNNFLNINKNNFNILEIRHC
jgi:GT2 family glycosyltransferase